MSFNVYNNYSSIGGAAKIPSFNLNDYVHKYYYNYFIKLLPNNKDINILEVGCGEGKLIHYLSVLGYNKVYGIDISKDQIEAAQKAGLKNTECIDAVNFLKDKSNTYDIIFLIDVLEHIEMNESFLVLQALHKSLKKGGKLVIQVPNAIAPFSPHRHHDITHLRAYTTFSLSQNVCGAGFNSLQIKGLPVFIHGLKSFIRKLIWVAFLNPFIRMFMLLMYGNTEGNIYTASMLGIAIKD